MLRSKFDAHWSGDGALSKIDQSLVEGTRLVWLLSRICLLNVLDEHSGGLG